MYKTIRRFNNSSKLPTSALLNHYRGSSVRSFASKPESQEDDSLKETGKVISGSDGDRRGRTGGGKALNSTAPGAPEPPKVDSFTLPRAKKGEKQELSKEAQEEVDAHNRKFYETHEKVKDNGDSGQK